MLSLGRDGGAVILSDANKMAPSRHDGEGWGQYRPRRRQNPPSLPSPPGFFRAQSLRPAGARCEFYGFQASATK
ncbi:hypothetical protein BV133_1972 [Blastochloris viridis]|uniref:Uncharacterized protein n=1 Tax=Blastochloris viridis TaxID=1079 RepID=A0A182D2C3_BLAVI|nr:hypothetical protein BV133_1972 [Blastochloris viridis]